MDRSNIELLLCVESESEVAQWCPTLCNPTDCSLSGSSVHGIFLARVLEWVAISFSRDLPDPGIELRSPALQADASSESPGKPNSPGMHLQICIYLKACRRKQFPVTSFTV